MAETDQSLIEHAFFADLAAAHRPAVGLCAEAVHFEASRYLFHEGDAADWLYLIRHGRVALEIAAPGKSAIIFETIGKGDVLGMFWLMPQAHWLHDARALDAVDAIAIEVACLRRACEADHALGYDLLKRFVPLLLRQLESAQLQLLDVYAHPN